MDAYAVLGVAPGASAAEVREAYLRRSKELHPDVGGTDAEMQALNAAYERFRDGAPLAPPLAAPPPAPRREPPDDGRRPPGPTECMICGSMPVEFVACRSEFGIVIWQQRSEVAGPMCRLCGLSLFRDFQNATLLKGWWGIGALGCNFVTIPRNLRARRALTRLPPPAFRDPNVRAPKSAPLAEGPPLYRRAGVYLTALLAIVLGGLVATSGATEPPGPNTPPRIHRLVGQCITIHGAEFGQVVHCAQPHDARIIDVVGRNDTCPAQTTSYFNRVSERVCVDETQ